VAADRSWRAASAATSGATVPSARAGVHACVRTHSEPQPEQLNNGSPSRRTPVAVQSHTSRQGFAARSVTWPVCPGRLPSPVVDARLTVSVRGQVQGVGFRWWTRARALELGLVGWASNLDDGRVEVVSEGPREACEALLALLGSGLAPGRVSGLTQRWGDALGAGPGFIER